MKFIDFIYFLSYRAYIRGNKERFGAFLISSLWIAALQFIWILIILTSIELYLKEKLFNIFTNPYSFVVLLIGVIILNNIYLHIGSRKNKIVNSFETSAKKEKLYWVILIIFFFVSFWLLGYVRHMSKDLFGW